VALATAPGAAVASATNCRVWTGLPALSPGAASNTLGGVVALSPCNVWAVGLYQDVVDGQSLSLAEHWNGTASTVVPTPSPDTDFNVLQAVSGSPGRVWAVGLSGGATFILRWNGAVWARVPSPSPGKAFNDLSGVSAVSATNAWAVGQFSAGTAARELILTGN
jgi:hypothetical protein